MNTRKLTAQKAILASCICLALAACSDSDSTSVPAADDPVVTDPGGDPPDSEVDIAEPDFSVVLFDEQSATVDNLFFPLEAGTSFEFEGLNDEGQMEKIMTTVSHQRRTVNGIESTVVVDRAYENGELVEETFDWYAQDKAGNVWYMGEDSTEFDGGEALSTDGSWEAGKDIDGIGSLAVAGIIMKAELQAGDTYRHEIYAGVAEDAAQIHALDVPFTFANGNTVNALQIREFNPLEPENAEEYKYYRSGFGLIAEEKVDGTSRVELIANYDQREPNLDAGRFSQSLIINHRYLPLTPGDVYTYEVDTEEGLERIIVEVLDETREVAGIAAMVVRDRVFLDNVLIEDTLDWFAQDDDGNVWYMGETVDNYEYDEAGNLLGINHDGSWEAGVDDAQPGITMPADPRIGDSYRQEYLPDEAEDIAAIAGLEVTVELRDGSSYSTLKTRDWNPLDVEAGVEFKYYADGVGLVREEDETGEEKVDLVSRMQR